MASFQETPEIIPQIERSKDFRFVFANVFNARFGDNDVMLSFAHDTIYGPTGPIFEEVCITMTPRSAKQLAEALTHMVNDFESKVGPIPMPPGAPEPK